MTSQYSLRRIADQRLRFLSCGAVIMPLVFSPSMSSASVDQVQTVEVNAVNANDKIRQAEPTIVSLYGHDDLIRYGDTSVSDVLKRLPGITVSENKNKETVISLRGMGAGYTQMLLNGEPTPEGFAIDSIAPDAIDHIEIMRVAGADKGAQAIAGSINIVLKKKANSSSPEVKWRLNAQQGRWSPGATLSTTGNAGQASFNLNAVVDRSNTSTQDQVTESLLQKVPNGNIADPDIDSARQLHHDTHIERDTLTLTPHVHWQRQPDDTISWQGFFNQLYIHQQKQEIQNQLTGASTDFPYNVGVWNAHMSTARNTFTWDRRLDNDAKWNVSVGWNFFRRVSAFHFIGDDADQVLLQTREVGVEAIENELRSTGKYTVPLSANHLFSVGWEMSRGNRHESRQEVDKDPLGSILLATDQPYAVTVDKRAVFVQDEWQLSTQWLAYLGLRWDEVNVESTQPTDLALRHTDRILAPVVQTVFKLDDQRQWRFALNRTLKAPALATLIPRVIRIDNDNGPLNPNQQGNPALRAEGSWGLDIAYEQFHTNGNTVSASTYVRQISDIIQDTLTWQSGGWLLQPTNNGKADVIGVEFETKFSLPTLNAALPAVNVHANVNRNWSQVRAAPGPDNHIADQVKLSANVSLDYRMGPGWTAGGNYSFQMKAPQRASSYLYSTESNVHDLDFFSVWQVTPVGQLRLSVSHLLRQNVSGWSVYEDPQIRATEQTTQRLPTVWHLVWEQRF